MAEPVMNHSERVAKRVVETVLQGSRLDYRSAQSNGEFDFDLRYDDGTLAALEVTLSIDRVQAETVAAILDEKKGGSTLPATKCKKSWIVFPTSGASINGIRKKVDDYLSQLESDGIEGFYWTDHHRSPQVRKICGELNLISCSTIELGIDPIIRISLPGGGGAVGASDAIEAGENEAQKDDNRKKLGAARTAQRHLVVYITPSNGLPWMGLTSFQPPSTLPNLPPEITSLWLIGSTESADKFIVWRASVSEPWYSMEVVCP